MPPEKGFDFTPSEIVSGAILARVQWLTTKPSQHASSAVLVKCDFSYDFMWLLTILTSAGVSRLVQTPDAQ